jgi:hypothetical protein
MILNSGALLNASTITLSDRQFGDFVARPQQLAAALGALDACGDKKLREWGVDPASYWALASRPKPIGHLADLFNSDLYPAIAGSRNVERNVIAVMEVGADGRVKSCNAPGDYAYPEFVKASCDVFVKGARFEPARDGSGNAVAAPFVQIVSFKLDSWF